MGASSESAGSRSNSVVRLVIGAGVVAALGWFFPLFRVVPLAPPAGSGNGRGLPAAPAAFEPAAAAKKFWDSELTAARSRALELKQVVTAVRENPETAKTKFSNSSGMGAAYFFVRGSGKVVARERNVLRVAVDGAPNEIVALRIGPIFGNTVRDGSGLLDVNAFPGLREFNALAAELNALVEKKVLPLLREKGNVDVMVHFAGCAEVPETAADAGEPLLNIVPVHAEIR